MKIRPINWLRLQSSSEFLAFPAFFGPTVGPIAAYLAQLLQTQFMPGREMLRQQTAQLSLRLQHAKQYSPYYGPMLEGIDFTNPKSVIDGFIRLPILTRSLLQDNGPALYTAPPKSHGKVEEKVTSGSTGQPVTVRTSAAAFALRNALTLRGHCWQDVNMSGRMAALRATVKGKDGQPGKFRANSWGGGVFRTGESGAMSSGLPTQVQMEWLMEFNPDYLLTYPSNLMSILKTAGKTKPSNIKSLMTLGETVSDELREVAKEQWGVPVYDRYSSEELGLVAVECTEGHYHLMSEAHIVEILNEDGKPCRKGEIGRVVVTDLSNYATCLFRYETRDYAEVGAPCSCGLRLPTLKKIMGRVRNMLRLPDGRPVWPVFGLRSAADLPPFKQYQVLQTAFTDLEVRLHVTRKFTEEDEAVIRARMIEKIGHTFNITFNYFDSELPLGANGKFEEFKCLIEN